jgi:hypothetical protein
MASSSKWTVSVGRASAAAAARPTAWKLASKDESDHHCPARPSAAIQPARSPSVAAASSISARTVLTRNACGCNTARHEHTHRHRHTHTDTHTHTHTHRAA